jgi:hypothetical protein
VSHGVFSTTVSSPEVSAVSDDLGLSLDGGEGAAADSESPDVSMVSDDS